MSWVVRPMGRIWFAANKSRWLVRPAALLAVFVTLAAVVAGSGLSPRALGTAAGPTSSPSASHTAAPSSSPSASASSLRVAVTSPTPWPSATEGPAADIPAALATRTTWATYSSATYHFRIKYPTTWYASEDRQPGWATILGSDGSNINVTWRAISGGTTLSDITAEVWSVWHSDGFAIEAIDPGVIAGLPARILTMDGMSPTGHPRHGIIGVFVTTTGRYRVELWSRPGSDMDDAALFNALVWTFQMA